MSDEELLEEIYRLQGNAAACPACYIRHGKERLKYYLSCKVEERDETAERVQDL